MKVVKHVAAIIGIVTLFYVSLGLGLQVSPIAGYAGLAGTVAVLVAYAYFGFIRQVPREEFADRGQRR